ncbi:MAG: hypothetical protein HUJ73_00485, partial [Eubacterium sp.]|nr:hypothetical protein [Eubacterium sp.]
NKERDSTPEDISSAVWAEVERNWAEEDAAAAAAIAEENYIDETADEYSDPYYEETYYEDPYYENTSEGY